MSVDRITQQNYLCFTKERLQDVLFMLEKCARLIGHGAGGKFFVLDGKVWFVPKNPHQGVQHYDYFEFCDELRALWAWPEPETAEGLLATFVPVPEFHLQPKARA